MSAEQPAVARQFSHFALLVTGKVEEKSLPSLFRSLAKTGRCAFSVRRRIDQLSPITSPCRKLRMIRGGKSIPDKDEEIALYVRRSLADDNSLFVIIVDDLEADRVDLAQQVY